MEYENRQPAEGINTPPENLLLRFFMLITGALVFIVILYFFLFLLGSWLAQRVSFTSETLLVNSLDIEFTAFQGFDEEDQDAVAIERALNELADKVMAEMPSPKGMEVTIHYVDNDIFNAFATLGGHVFFHRGLLEHMPHENALAMVMAHEIAHVIERHPIKGFGGSVTSGLTLSLLSSYAGTAGNFISASSILTGTSFSRTMESDADALAISAINDVYGHVAGADELFRLLMEQKDDDEATTHWVEKFTSTHPLDKNRVLAISEAAEKNAWLLDGKLTPLPEVLATW